MDKNLHISVLPSVKLFIRLGRIVNTHLMADYKARLCPSRNDHVPQIAIVCLDIALAGTQVKTLRHNQQAAAIYATHPTHTFSKSLPNDIKS